jgi:signal transduction histidine kinase
MAIFKGKTIEGFITFRLTMFAVLFLILFFLLLWRFNLSVWHIALATSLMALGWIIAIVSFRSRVISGFSRALLHLEAVRMEDYKQYAKPLFSQGIVGKFYQQLRDFSEDLSIKKLRYDQHAFLVYQLIDQLGTPVLVFNQKNQLTYANGAFSLLYGQPWQMYRQASPKLLGLIKQENGWQLQHTNQQKKQQWQISQSTFIDAGVAHQLLVFTNIESALRTSQFNAWQQIINVMGHEIRNSLTPVSTIAESLSVRTETARDKEALALISERCHHLQDFINRYASVSQQINLNYQQIPVAQLANRLKGLFTNIELEVAVTAQWIWADKSILEQVLINLIKNAHEAGAHRVILDFSEDDNKTTIKVIDDGHGFANLENLFVPLFSTKQDGQGIGLSFCRNIIEQHQGSIILVNNRIQGVTVTITLPLKISKIR